MRPIILLLLIAGWHTSAQAFFCFSFDSQSRHDRRHASRAWLAPPPPLPAYSRYPGSQPTPLPFSAGNQLPPIRETKKSPEIIQGYRFRPLTGDPATPAIASPKDWRD